MSSPQPPGAPRAARSDPMSNGTSLLDRYQIERAIGMGAYGRVYLAMDTRLRRSVAIKELRADRAQAEPTVYAEYLARFEREARATGIIQQPNVVTVYDEHTDASGNHYLVTEYVDGTSLRDLLVQVGTLPVNRAVAITSDIARALEAVHERGIVHRDVKPANLMISRRGVAKLTDFGIALVAGEQQMTAMTGGHPGTPEYMSPEQAAGYGPIDGRSDLYSLGLVLYEMLVGEPYARRQQPLAAVRPDLPPGLLTLEDKLLAPAADARYQSASDLLNDLQNLSLISSSTQSLPGGPPPSMAPPGSYPPGAYSGMPGQPPPSAPPGIYGAPPSMPPAAPPPVYGGGTMPPVYPGAPPPRSNRGVIIGIVGAVIAVLVIVAGVFVLTHRGGDDTSATATPVVGATTPTAQTTAVANVTTVPTATANTVVLTTPTRAPTVAIGSSTATTPTVAGTPTTAATITPTRPATSPTSAPATLTETWTDPDGLIAMNFPSGWTKGKDSTDPTSLVELSSSNAPFVDIYLDDPQQGTIADEILIITRNQANSQKYNYTNQATQDLKIGGEPAKLIAFTYTDKADATKTFQGAYWVVNHEGRQYSIAASPIGSSRATVDAMVASVTFPKAKVTTWIDPDKVMRARYPNEWAASSDKDNALILNGANDEVHIFVSIAPVGNTTIDQAFKAIRDSGSDDGKTVRTYDPVVDTKVGGQAAKSMAYKYAPKSSPSSTTGTATIWIVDYKGKRYEFFCSNVTLHRPEIETFINTVAFIK